MTHNAALGTGWCSAVVSVDFGRAPDTHWDYATAADGKEANTAGAALRCKRGQLNYL